MKVVLSVVCVVAAASFSQAALVGPYAVDSNTLHLWHLDEAGTPAADQAHYNYAGTFTTKPDANQPLNALFGGASLGNTGFSGWGKSYGTTLNTKPSSLPPFPANSVQPGLGALTPNNGTADNADHTFDNPLTHAFTMEAIVRIDFDPTQNYSQPQEIIAGEGDAGDSSDRSWQFRIEANTAAVTGTPWKLRFQKVSGFGGVGGSTSNYNLDANIPSIVQGGWYHVAVSYNGNLTDAASLKLYWTELNDANVAANMIGSGNMNGWLRQQDTDFALGNEMRDFNGNTEPFSGLIDEVRISDVARDATAMQFTTPEPASLASLALLSGLVARRRK